MDDNSLTSEEAIAREASAWVERLKNAGPKEVAEFGRWLRESRAHVREMLLASSWEVVLRHIGQAQRFEVNAPHAARGNVLTMRATSSPRTRRVTPRWPWLAVAASFVVMALITWLLTAQPFIREGLWHDYETRIGEQRSVELDDGSVITLNAASRLEVAFSNHQRDVYLREGQALFTVAHEAARPFRVHAGASVVQAIGTTFDVRRVADRIEVAVLEGRVQVTPQEELVRREAQPHPISLSAGQTIQVDPTGVASAPTPVQLAEISAWRQRRLIFRDRPLGEIVSEFRRYNRSPRIVIEDESLKAMRLNGVFDADDLVALEAYLTGDGQIEISKSRETWVIRRR